MLVQTDKYKKHHIVCKIKWDVNIMVDLFVPLWQIGEVRVVFVAIINNKMILDVSLSFPSGKIKPYM